MSNINKWKGYRFQTATERTSEYIAFEKTAKADLKRQANQNGLSLERFIKNHFDFSAFLKNPETEKYVYISIPDVRFFVDKWFSEVLIRTAKSEKDYTGGVNLYTTWNEIGKKAYALTAG